MMFRIPLSRPDVGSDERQRLLDVLEDGGLSDTGARVTQFEEEFAALLGDDVEAVAVVSGTVALQLALLVAGVKGGQEVLCPTLAHAAPVKAIQSVGADPVLVDCDLRTWNIDSELVVAEIEKLVTNGRAPAALIVVDLFGQCVDYSDILKVARMREIPVIEDAAQALGATYDDRPAGTLGDYGVFSFADDHVLTTTGGGMFVTKDLPKAEQARSMVPTDGEVSTTSTGHVLYEHRLDDLLAELGRTQLASLERRVRRQREIFALYRRSLTDLPGLSFQQGDTRGEGSRSLTCIRLDPADARHDRDGVLEELLRHDIESRPVDEPRHLRATGNAFRVLNGQVAESVAAQGLCLPSGASLRDDEVVEVIEVVAACLA